MNTIIPKRQEAGFSFVEAIFTIAIIGIMSSIVVAAISNAARDSYRVLSRQQQATVQSAVTAWVMAQTRVGNTAQFQSLENVRQSYNALGGSKARFNLLVPNPSSADPSQRAGFLDQTTADQFLSGNSGASQLQTDAMYNSQQYLTLPDWQSGDFPHVNLVGQ